jgi:hypothetical protein
MLIVYNGRAIGVLVVGFTLAAVLGMVCPNISKAVMLATAGALCCAGDLLFRFKWGGRRWFHPSGGGHFFFAPVWTLALLGLIGYASAALASALG